MQRDLSPPAGGTPPPATAELPNGEALELIPIAVEIARRFFLEFPDEEDRYGKAGHDWCVHDNQWLLAWAVTDLSVGGAHFANNVRWLAGILRARDYPVTRLCRDLELAGDVVGERGPEFADLAEKLRSGAVLLARRAR